MGNDIIKTYSNPLDVWAAAPFVLLHDSVYYLYRTYNPAPNLGIPVFTSKDLVNWEKHTCLAFTKTRGTWSQHHF
ncbi:MAG TPA: hypothetical protein G4N98_06340 [Thermoflexia bacterium]|nr:hypothetical protein [Thermoflexia bacterium]